VMPARLRQRVDALQVTSVGRSGRRVLPKVDTEQLIAVGMAARAREVLRFDYATAAPGSVPEGEWAPPRRVEPHHLVTWGGRWYLVAWDLDRNDWRTFRVDRMECKSPTGPRFTPRDLPAPDVASYIAAKFERSTWPCTGEVIVAARAADIAPWVHGQGVVEELGPQRCRLVLGSWSWAAIAATVGMFETDMEIVGPPELRAAMADLARRCAAATA